ncbi:MAG: 50S ribosomal protein L1 [Pseudomonadota bacterium]|nr:50S ribosomal protein L1 [Pseudomonadota bacterium]
MNDRTKQVNQLDTAKTWNVSTALEKIKEMPSVKFDEAIDISLHLGVDARKMMVRGTCSMPAGLGKKVKIAVFAKGDAAKAAEEAGADRVGSDDLVEEMQNQAWAGYNVIIATPDCMGMLAKLARKLGPKGLMPNPKLGTVTNEAAEAVKKAKLGQAKFKIDKAGIIHCSIGKKSFKVEDLQSNLAELIRSVKKLKPASAKGQYLKKLYINSTMGKYSLKVDTAEFA